MLKRVAGASLVLSAYNRQDRFFKKAKKEQFAARSIYKLEEIDKRFSLFRKGFRIVNCFSMI